MQLKKEAVVQPNYKKIVLKTVLFTLLALIISLGIVVMLMFFVFTKDFANMMNDLGFEKTASNLYYRVYEKTDDIYYCYKSLNIRIVLDDSEKIVEMYEDFVSDKNYDKFMLENKSNIEKLDIGCLDKSALLNDENYLTKCYVRALLNCENDEKAWDLSINEFANYKDFSFKDQGVYTLSLWIEREDWGKFSNVYEGFDDQLIVEMQEYFGNAYDLFVENQNCSNGLDKAYLIALGNRIIAIGQDVNSVYNGLNINSDMLSDNLNKMIVVNDVIKGLI